ncbi:MAG TPA: DUF502 domain-containing protein [Steroidobacteraceae bacterium]|nr:DUF502 domain-containing protein [Steroidobacteraceae bacterium]
MARLRDLLVSGLLLTLPTVVVLYLLYKVVATAKHVFAPVSRLLPQGTWFGIGMLDIAAVLALILLLIAIGAFAVSAAGRRLGDKLEDRVLSKLPGFLFFKSMAAGFSSEKGNGGLTPALIAFDDNTVIGFVVEPARSPDERVTVFVPAAPTPAVGSLFLVESARVTPLDIPVHSAMQAVSRLGVGLQKLTPPLMGPKSDSVARAVTQN